MKKVLFFNYQLVAGGAEKVMVDIVNHMDPLKYDITVITVIDCSHQRHILNENIKYKFIFKNIAKIDRLYFKIMRNANPEYLHRKLIKDEFDIEIAALEGIPAKVISGNTRKETKKICIIHADCQNMAWPNNRYKGFMQERESYNNFNDIIFVSNNSKEKFIERFKIDKSKLHTIYNPFDKQLILKKADESIGDLIENIDYKSEKVFISVGRLDKVKGYSRLIEVFKTLTEVHKNLKLLIIGEGQERDNLERKIKELELNDKIYLLGYKNNPYKYMRLSDFYICSSFSEGLNSAIIEAMIVGIPVITTDCGGMNEILEDGKCGLITTNSKKGIYQAIKETLSGNADEKFMLSKYDECIEKFEFNSYLNKLEKLFK